MKTSYWVAASAIVLLGWLLLSRSPQISSLTQGVTPDSGASLFQAANGVGESGTQISNPKAAKQAPRRFVDPLASRDRFARRTFLTSASELSGRTVNPDGEPISGVVLELNGRADGEIEPDRFLGRTVSTVDGDFRLDLPDSFGGWLSGRAEGYSPVRQPIWSAGPGKLRKVIVLNPKAGPLRVIVSEVLSRKRASQARVEAHLISPDPGDEVTRFECQTDESGECLLSDLPAQRRIQVMASKRGHFEGLEEILTGVEPRELPLSIIRGPTLLLQVLASDGREIPQARVERPDGMTVTTDQEGKVWMPVIDELVTTQVTVSAPGFRSQEATIANDGSTQWVELEAAPTLTGTVIDPTAAPLPGVHVSLSRRVRRSTRIAETASFTEAPEFLAEESVTDRDGNFEISLADSRALLLTANRQGFLEWSRNFAADDRTFPDSIQITLQPFASVVLGQTLNPAGVPIESSVIFTRLDPAPGSTVRNPSRATGGFYLVGDLQPGEYLVQARTEAGTGSQHGRYQSDAYRIEVVHGNRLQLDLTLQVVETADSSSVSGRREP